MRRYRWLRTHTLLATLATGCLFDGCFGSAMALRFREAYAPGFVEGISIAVSDPEQWRTGVRRGWAALIEGLGAIITPRDSSSQ